MFDNYKSKKESEFKMMTCGGYIFYYDKDDNKYYGIYNMYNSWPDYLGKLLKRHFNTYKKAKILIKTGNSQPIHIKGINDKIGDKYYLNKCNDVEIFSFNNIEEIKKFEYESKYRYDYIYIFNNNV